MHHVALQMSACTAYREGEGYGGLTNSAQDTSTWLLHTFMRTQILYIAITHLGWVGWKWVCMAVKIPPGSRYQGKFSSSLKIKNKNNYLIDSCLAPGSHELFHLLCTFSFQSSHQEPRLPVMYLRVSCLLAFLILGAVLKKESLQNQEIIL